MNINKIEGCAWHFLVDKDNQNYKEENHLDFVHLMQQEVLMSRGKSVLRGASGGRNQRYRLMGGRANGLVCDISEEAGHIYLRLEVLQLDLYNTLNAIVPGLLAVLRGFSYPLYLEIVHAHSVI